MDNPFDGLLKKDEPVKSTAAEVATSDSKSAVDNSAVKPAEEVSGAIADVAVKVTDSAAIKIKLRAIKSILVHKMDSQQLESAMKDIKEILED